ncbi:MAG: SOUL family heme-binding protein [Planctomycetota bacterium]
MMKFKTLRALVLATAAAWSIVFQTGGFVKAQEDYESAEYKVIESEGKLEVREYPDLMLAATTTKMDSPDSGNSFMQLFRYISGANEKKQKIAMTTPVFMESQGDGAKLQMGFVMPKQIASQGVPKPTVGQVQVRKRTGGRFAVVRFSGQMTDESVEESESKLRSWMESKGLVADDSSEGDGVETAVYDSPFTPGPERRNELLIRLKATK